jgi:hypothetical protein
MTEEQIGKIIDMYQLNIDEACELMVLSRGRLFLPPVPVQSCHPTPLIYPTEIGFPHTIVMSMNHKCENFLS